MLKEEKYMNNQNKCDKYESIFTFGGEDALYNHIENCPDCQEEHKKQQKISSLVREVAPMYLKKQETRKISAIKKLACCFVMFVGLTGFMGIKMYDDYSFQTSMVEDSYVENMGLPTDKYGFLEI